VTAGRLTGLRANLAAERRAEMAELLVVDWAARWTAALEMVVLLATLV
jgi:hypothetical protein